MGVSEMSGFIGFLVGAIGGFAAHVITMKVSFKQRTIENKIKIYDSLIGTWVQMRNFIFAHHTGNPSAVLPLEQARQFDQMYGQSQQLIGEAVLVCEDEGLTTDLNALNERIYRTPWHGMKYDQVNTEIEKFKSDALQLVARLRNDIKASTRFELADFIHIASGFTGTSTSVSGASNAATERASKYGPSGELL